MLRRRFLVIGAVGLVAALAVALQACGGGDKARRTDVAVGLSEWEVVAAPEQVQAGEVVFEVSNTGEVAHNLVVVKSDLPPGELPLGEDGAVEVSRLNVMGSAVGIAPGTAIEEFRLSLTAGKYVLFCDVVLRGRPQSESHYENGMYASFFVEP